MITVTAKDSKQNVVLCEDCGLHLCGRSLDSSLPDYGRIEGVLWEARHPHPNDVDKDEAPGAWELYDRCPNKGKTFGWKWKIE